MLPFTLNDVLSRVLLPSMKCHPLNYPQLCHKYSLCVTKICFASILSYFCLKPEVPQDPEEAARLQQLQAAAAQWQKVQQQRAGLQYQALMQQHEKLQQILEKYQQLIQQPTNLQVSEL